MFMMKYFSLLILCFYTIVGAHAQKKAWQTIVFTSDSKAKGVLKEANDSSLILLTKSGEETFLYNDVRRLKFIRKKNTGIKVIGGIIVGASLGAPITANQLTKGKQGEPAALSSAVGATVGGFLGAIVGAFSAPPLCNSLFARKINVNHTRTFYQSLSQKLQPYKVK